MTGLIIMAIIAVPVIVLVVASFFGASGMSKVPGLFVGSVILLTAVIILVLAVFGAILGFIVPG